MRFVIISVFAFALSACANNYDKFYSGLDAATGYHIVPQTPEAVDVIHAAVDDDTITEIIENGYSYSGHSGWQGSAQSDSFARRHAFSIGASKVLIETELLGSSTSSVPLTLPNTQTTHHSGSYGGYGTGGGTYSGTSTTYGTRTTYIPVTRNTYETHAYYFFKRDMRDCRLCVDLSKVSSEKSSLLGSNGGVEIIVLKGGPAYRADFISGDIVTRLNDDKIWGPEEFASKMQQVGGPTRFTVFRNGRFIEISMNFN